MGLGDEPAGLITKPCAYPVDESLERLVAAIAAHGLTLFARFDHSDAAAAIGLTMPRAHVLVFGSPRGGTPAMLAQPRIALDLPLRILVWADGAGAVWVTYTNPAYLAARFGLPEAIARPLAIVEVIAAAAL